MNSMLILLSKIFGYLVKKRNEFYDSGKKKIIKIKTPVISIGNLSVGGAGKTPFTAFLANEILKLGFKPAIVGRGYGRKNKDISIISDGKNIFCDVYSAGDEMLMLAEKSKVPVVVNNSKARAAKICEKHFKPDVILVDDGFQHRTLFRNLDILILTPENFEKPFLFPKGKLREPLQSIERADIICLNGDFKNYSDKISSYANSKLVLKLEVEQSEPFSMISDFDLKIDKQNKFIVISSIANPLRFENMLESKKYQIAGHKFFRDHHYFTSSDINTIIQLCKKNNVKNIAVTEKDSVKLRQFSNQFIENKINCWIFPLEIDILEKKVELIEILNKLLSKN